MLLKRTWKKAAAELASKVGRLSGCQLFCPNRGFCWVAPQLTGVGRKEIWPGTSIMASIFTFWSSFCLLVVDVQGGGLFRYRHFGHHNFLAGKRVEKEMIGEVVATIHVFIDAS